MVYVPSQDGTFISEKVARIAELIQQYDHRLEVRWIPPDKRAPDEPMFAIVEHTPEGRVEVCFYVQDESFFDERLLGRIYEGDTTKKDVLAELEAYNRAVNDYKRKVKEEQMAEAKDMSLSMLRSPLHTYRHNGRKIDL